MALSRSAGSKGRIRNTNGTSSSIPCGGSSFLQGILDQVGVASRGPRLRLPPANLSYYSFLPVNRSLGYLHLKPGQLSLAHQPPHHSSQPFAENKDKASLEVDGLSRGGSDFLICLVTVTVHLAPTRSVTYCL
ncbi:uncharacterized protein LOC111245189 [Varroa destructor]|uniref:Uncharacterized protein n=1 Tax=Varroa destructor TaxID=109461 RepID=A0A7M7J9X2_VARDE|nr:uncharacterized protein LOC111245189 [Varroa destructor]